MIIVRLSGGMGNQMFQYAAGLSLAKKLGTELKIDKEFLLAHHLQRGSVKRWYDLSIFNINEEFATKEEISKHVPTVSKSWIFYKLKENLLKQKNVYTQPFFHYDNRFQDIKDNTYLIGGFQSEKYFFNVTEEIKKQFTFKESISKKSFELLSKIKNTDSICINVRRTDFVTNKHTNQCHGTIGLDYYNKALDIVKGGKDDFHIYVFSDDIEWCKNNLKYSVPTVYVSHEHAGEKFRDYLELMISCRHFIIPNSTFAWWAAWLSDNKEKIIICPHNWIADKKHNDNDVRISSSILL